MEEVNRQKIEKEYPDWQKLADVSNAVTQELKEKAVQLAQEDEKERKRVWSESTSNAEAQTQNVASSSAPREKKKKGGLFGFFKKKSK